jgi:hypothetical protein
VQVINDTGLKLAVIPAQAESPQQTATILLKGTFTIVPDGRCIAVPEADQREFSADKINMDELGRSPSWVTDFAPFKPHTDCFVFGIAYAPGGVPVPGFRAGFRVGPLVKGVQLWGPRVWRKDGTATPPEPVAAVPLRWELSSGGLMDAANPFGRGQEPDETGVVHMPQIEDANDPVKRMTEPKPPVNLAPVPPYFAERAVKAGTRDQRWALFRSPLPPLDYDPSFHNAAPIDQQAGNYPRGNEPLTLVNLHATLPMVNSALPGVRPRVIVVRQDDSHAEAVMNLDTIILLPNEEKLVLLWRAQIPVADAALSDISIVTGCLETIGEPSHSADDLAKPALAAHRAAKPADVEAELAKAEADTAIEVRKLLKDVDLPAPLRAIVETETKSQKLLDALLTHVETALAKAGHMKGKP